MVGKKIFDVNTLTKVLAFYVLQSLPSTLQMTANNIYQLTEISGTIPTLGKVLSEIEISLSHKNEQSKVIFNALRAQENKNHKWKTQPDCTPHAISSSAILDSGASYSIFKDSSCFVSVKGIRISLSLADGSSITASGIGTAIILSNDGQPIYLQNSLVIPSISVPLIPLGPFLKKNCCLIGKGDVVELVSSNGETLLTGSLTDRVVCVKVVEPKANHISCRDDALAFHKALGHPSLQYATRMRPEMDFSSVNCESCILSKSH
ncbi:hypothetical protein O181_079462 [Austropuccinia psidii MF-1]|uniref:Retrovirus-related Pol polyprotein from transposon TNT 1-94-like beta-barrel domain-containing protein n=1 Tax=Austropuccinia psidii MF-1 TaxID=1389203 RepID=A0A9Q3FM43_9BASI|nr:hypothetical protein [Austropuccinia psidii MF-1]